MQCLRPGLYRDSARRIVLPLCLQVILLLVSVPRILPAAEGDTSQPLVIVSFPNLDRMTQVIDQLTTQVGREDIKDQFVGMVRERMERMHRDPTQATAQMVFMKPGFPPSIVNVDASPITDVDKYLDGVKETFRWIDDAVMRQVKDEPNLWEYSNPQDPDGGYVGIRIEDGYAYRSMNRDLATLNFKGLHREIGPVAGRNDIGMSVFPEAVPLGLRQVFVTFLRNAIAAELQQQDGELQATYQARKSTGNYFLDLLEQILNQSDGASLGLTLQKDGTVAIDLYIDAMADSKLAAFLSHFGGKTSRFQSIASDPSADTLHLSFALDEPTKEWLTQLVDSASALIGIQLEVDNPSTHPIAGLFESLKTTLKSGHFDFILQAYGQPFEAMVFTGGMRIRDGAGVAQAIRELMTMISERTEAVEITIDAESYEGVTLHTLSPKVSDQGADDFFGGRPELWIGASESTIWFAFGGGECFLELTSVMDRVRENRVETAGSKASIVAKAQFGRWFNAITAAERRNRGAVRAEVESVEGENREVPRAESVETLTPEQKEDRAEAEADEAERQARRQERLARARGMGDKIRNRMETILADGQDEMEFRLTTSESGLRGQIRLGPALSKAYVTAAITGFETFSNRDREEFRDEAIRRRLEQQRRENNP